MPVATPVKKDVKIEAPVSKEFQIKMEELKRLRGSDQDTIKDLKSQLKRAQNDVKDMKLLLDMYKTCTKEQRDKAQLMAAEKKVRTELEETRNQVIYFGPDRSTIILSDIRKFATFFGCKNYLFYIEVKCVTGSHC